MKDTFTEVPQLEQGEISRDRLLDPRTSGQHEMNLLDLFILLAQHKKSIAFITLGAACVAALIALLLPNHYRATASIMPPQQTQSTASMLMSQLAGTGMGSLAALAGKDLGLKTPNDLFIGILESRTVEDAIIRQYDLRKLYRDKKMSDARLDLQKASEIHSGKDGLIDISVEDKDPKRAADMANSYVDELRKLMQHLAVTEASQRRMFFEQQMQESKDDLANAEVALKETEQKTGMLQLDSQSKAVIEAIGRIRAQIAAKQVQLRAMASFATDQNPDYVVAQQELAGLQVELGKFEKQEPSKRGNNDPLLAAGTIPESGLEYVRHYREVKYREAVFEVMAKQFEAAKLDEAKEAAVIQVIDRAVPPDQKSWPHRAVIVVIAAFGGLLAGCVWVLGSEGMHRMKKDPRVAEQLSQLKFNLHSGADTQDYRNGSDSTGRR